MSTRASHDAAHAGPVRDGPPRARIRAELGLLTVLTLAMPAAGVWVAARFGDLSMRAGHAMPAGAGERQVTSVVDVVARDFAFEPKEIRVKAGRVRFLVKNEGAVDHEFAILGVAEHEEHDKETIRPATTYTLDVDLRPGTYDVYCGLPGHREAGMVSILVVEREGP